MKAAGNSIRSIVDKDTFTLDRLPSREHQADYLFGIEDLKYPKQLNCIDSLIQVHLDAGRGDLTAIHGNTFSWTYSELDRKVNQIANILTLDYGLVPGNRVFLRGANSPHLAAIWLAVVKAGLIAVTTMPLMRARDLKPIIDKAQIKFVICQSSLLEEVSVLEKQGDLETVVIFDTEGLSGQLNTAMLSANSDFRAYESTADDVALIAFTSGTTGKPKGCVHYHRDVLSMAKCFSKNILKPTTDDVFIGSPPLAFTFGLGAVLVFPLFAGASTVLIENAVPIKLAEAIARFKATISFTSPTGYSVILDSYDDLDLHSLRLSVSAGEHLNSTVYKRWRETTGITMINGIGSTEMIHIFVSTTAEENAPGLTGRVIPGYQACVMDEKFNILDPGNEGLLAVKGPTGCKYLDDGRQTHYVHQGWNMTGDVFYQDEEKRFWFKGRSDDMIVSSGYNISSIEVEVVVNEHPAVSESAVIGVRDAKRGKLVKAFVVLEPGVTANSELALEIQNFVKSETSPYKYPRIIEFIEALPKTETGKIQRFRLG